MFVSRLALEGVMAQTARVKVELIGSLGATGKGHGSDKAMLLGLAVQQVLAGREGPVVSVERLAPGDPAVPLGRLVVERSVSINTAAAGGNASLMTMA